MTNLFLFILIFSAVYLLFSLLIELFTHKDTIIKYIFIFICLIAFIIIQTLSIKHNYFEYLNEVLFIYMWWYFIFSSYGLYKREHELRLLEPIKFSLFPTYFYKLIKRSIKIRYYVLKELFLSFNLRDCIIIGLIFIMSYACLRILRTWLIYEIITIYGLDVLASKYLTVFFACVYEVFYFLKHLSKVVIDWLKEILLKNLLNIYLGYTQYEYLYMLEIKKKFEEPELDIKKLLSGVLQMKWILPVVRGDVPHISGETTRFFIKKKPVEISEMSIPIVIPDKNISQLMTKKELIEARLYSASGVPLYDFNTGFPLYKLSKSKCEVCLFEDSGNLIDTYTGFINFHSLNLSVLKEFLGQATVNKQYLFFHENRYEIQQAHRYNKLHKQYIDKGEDNMGTGAFKNYNKYKNTSGFKNYFDIISDVKGSLTTQLSPYISNILKTNFLLNDQQLLYEISMFMSLIGHIDPKDFTVYILETKFKSNEHDIIIINNVTKEELSVQLKTITSTNNYLMSDIKNYKLKYKKNTDILVVSSSVGQVLEVLNPKNNEIVNTLSQSIFNLNRKFESPRIYLPDCYNVQKALDYHQKILEVQKNVHHEIINNKTIYHNTTATGVSNEPCIKPSSIKKSKIKN